MLAKVLKQTKRILILRKTNCLDHLGGKTNTFTTLPVRSAKTKCVQYLPLFKFIVATKSDRWFGLPLGEWLYPTQRHKMANIGTNNDFIITCFVIVVK